LRDETCKQVEGNRIIMPTTLKEIAAAAGVSHVTVHNALHGRGRLSESRRREICRIARRLGYRANAGARAMQQGRFDCAALVVSLKRTWSQTPEGLLRGIESALAERDMHLTVAALPDEKLTSTGYVPKILRTLMADGLLVNYNAHIPERMSELLADPAIPAIWINSRQSGNCVYPDDYAAAADATRRLLELGHRHVAYVDYTSPSTRTPGHYSQVDRRQGYQDAMVEAGLRPHRIGNRRLLTRDEVVSSLQAVMAVEDRPTATLTYGPTEGQALLFAAALSRLHVPSDLSIVTFAEEPLRNLDTRFATCVLPEEELGRRAVRKLLTRIECPAEALPAEAVPLGFDRGRTLAPPPEPGGQR